jgi:hypothetical protein
MQVHPEGALRVATRYLRAAFKPGDYILFGKFRNKRGRIVRVFDDERGIPYIEVEPVPKGRKKNRIFGLYTIRKMSPEAVAEAKALEAESIKTAGESELPEFLAEFGRSYPRLRHLIPKVVEKDVSRGGGHPEASQHNNEIWIFPKFWLLDDETRDFVFAHEIGHHVLSQKNTLWIIETAKRFGVDAWDTSSLPFGQFNMDEAFADSFASYHVNPGELRRRYPAWLAIVESV